MFESKHEEDRFRQLQEAFRLSVQSEGISVRLRKAGKAKQLEKKPMPQLIEDAVSKGVLTPADRQILEMAERMRNTVIQVDDFPAKAPGSVSKSHTQ